MQDPAVSMTDGPQMQCAKGPLDGWLGERKRERLCCTQSPPSQMILMNAEKPTSSAGCPTNLQNRRLSFSTGAPYPSRGDM